LRAVILLKVTLVLILSGAGPGKFEMMSELQSTGVEVAVKLAVMADAGVPPNGWTVTVEVPVGANVCP